MIEPKLYLTLPKIKLVNRFSYKKITSLPNFQKAVFNFKSRILDSKLLASSSLALRLAANRQPSLSYAMQRDEYSKIRKGSPTGCKVVLYKKAALMFLMRQAILIIPKLSKVKNTKLRAHVSNNECRLSLNNMFVYEEVDELYFLFERLTPADFRIFTKKATINEAKLIFESLQLQTIVKRKKACKYNSMVECDLAKVEIRVQVPLFAFNIFL